MPAVPSMVRLVCDGGCGREGQCRSTREMPVVGIDYCFPALLGRDGWMVLIVVEIYSGVVESILVDAKGIATSRPSASSRPWRLVAFSEQAFSPPFLWSRMEGTLK